MAETRSFTIEEFYKFVSERKLMAAKCKKCGKLLLPPRPVCTECVSTDLRWVELEKRGKLLTYTAIHVSPSQFQSMAPYVVGIIELRGGAKLPGMIRDIEPEKIKVGMQLEVDFDTTQPSEWPTWPRYFFRSP
ncbi:MAG: Zn-ribbon domain-containing OB-fold protein [Candidatus Bathyarchaeia archaeon]